MSQPVRLLLLLLIGLAWGCGTAAGGSDFDPNRRIACDDTTDVIGQCPPGQVCWRKVCDAPDAPCGGCGAGKTCVGTTCKTRCESDAGCLRPGLCNVESRLCDGEPSFDCEPTCPVGEVCLSGVCKAIATLPCRNDSECDGANVCRKTPEGARLGTCAAVVCSRDADCKSEDKVCDVASGSCILRCRDDVSCGPGKECVAGFCRPLPPQCEDDYGCSSRYLCNEYKQCVRGPVCDVGDSAFCGPGRVCHPIDRRCAPEGCAVDADCPTGQVCNTATRHCEQKVPDGGSCAADDQCLTGSRCILDVCRRLCDPKVDKDHGACRAGFLCTLQKSGPMVGQGICQGAILGRKDEGVTCTIDLECQVDLFCIEGWCLPPCDPEAGPQGRECPDDRKFVCRPDTALGAGICRVRPCDDETHPCPSGQHCATTGPFAGKCKPCTEDSHCPTHYVCDLEVNECVRGCRDFGCDEENTYCDRATNRCIQVCQPGCEDWERCTDGRCVAAPCDPACDSRCACRRGRCECPPDCRDPATPCVAPLICDAGSGNCNPPACPPCAEGQCCDASTQYQCGQCNLCSATNPTGFCPYGQECRRGACADIPPQGANRPCGPLSTPMGAVCADSLQCCEPWGFPGAGGTCCTVCNPNGSCGSAP